MERKEIDKNKKKKRVKNAGISPSRCTIHTRSNPLQIPRRNLPPSPIPQPPPPPSTPPQHLCPKLQHPVLRSPLPHPLRPLAQIPHVPQRRKRLGSQKGRELL